jgi:alpha-tubulin suppressor-like RCC1 family protein
MAAGGVAAATSAAVTASGSLRAWGDDHYGQLGDSTTTNRDRPVAVRLPAGTTVTSVRAGSKYRLALTSAGAVLAWGGNFSWQLGDAASCPGETISAGSWATAPRSVATPPSRCESRPCCSPQSWPPARPPVTA